MKNTNDIQSLGLQIQEKEERLVQINEEFNKLIQQSKYFEEYQRLDSELKEFRKEFDKAAIKFLKKTNPNLTEDQTVIFHCVPESFTVETAVAVCDLK